jgi:hypothetical protein
VRSSQEGCALVHASGLLMRSWSYRRLRQEGGGSEGSVQSLDGKLGRPGGKKATYTRRDGRRCRCQRRPGSKRPSPVVLRGGGVSERRDRMTSSAIKEGRTGTERRRTYVEASDEEEEAADKHEAGRQPLAPEEDCRATLATLRDGGGRRSVGNEGAR